MIVKKHANSKAVDIVNSLTIGKTEEFIGIKIREILKLQRRVVIMQSIAIIVLIIAILVILIRRFAGAGIKNEHVKNLSADETNEFIKQNKNAFILDVRTKGEYQSGHIPGARNVPVNELPSRISEIEKYKDRPVVVYCASGGRSPSAVRILLKSDFNSIYHMNRGISTWNHKIERK